MQLGQVHDLHLMARVHVVFDQLRAGFEVFDRYSLAQQ
jgi:hypothetical protein